MRNLSELNSSYLSVIDGDYSQNLPPSQTNQDQIPRVEQDSTQHIKNPIILRRSPMMAVHPPDHNNMLALRKKFEALSFEGIYTSKRDEKSMKMREPPINP